MPDANVLSIQAGADYLDDAIGGANRPLAQRNASSWHRRSSAARKRSCGDLAHLFGPLRVIDLGDFLAQSIPARETILAPIILQQSLTMILCLARESGKHTLR
jgi:hypothetical protein